MSLPESPASHRTYFPALDGLRALALLLVFVSHYAGAPILGEGVNVFFVLSGFLITGILWDTREQPSRVRNFYMRRTLRIFPLYWGLFLLLWLTTPLIHWQWNRYWLFWPAYLGNHLLFTAPRLPIEQWQLVALAQLGRRGHGTVLMMGHFWSLCVEEQFYLLWPWAVFFLPRRALLWLCGVVALVLPFARVWAPHIVSEQSFRDNIAFRILPFQLDALLIGGGLALLLRGGSREWLLRQARWAADAAMAFALIYVYCRVDLHIPWLHQPFLGDLGMITWQLSVTNLLSAAVILGCLQPACLTHRLLHWGPGRALGRISYGAYVCHDLFHVEYGYMAQRLMPNSTHVGALTLLFAAVGTVVLASLSFRCFEQPILRWKDRLTRAS